MLMNHEYDILVKFVDIHVGTVAKKRVNINDLPKPVTLSRFTPYEHMRLLVINMKLKSDELEVTYFPTIPYSNHVCYFHLNNNDQLIKTICVVGNCIGPTVSLSTRYLNFYRFPEKTVTEKTIEIINHSSISTKYQIIFDKNSVFVCREYYGELRPKRHAYIRITFKPKKHGPYYQPIMCLVKNHEPLILEAYGIYGLFEITDFIKLQRYTRVNYSPTVQTYMTNIVYDKQNNGILSIKNKNLDFGNFYNQNFVPVMKTSIQNISQECVLIQFDKSDLPVTAFELNETFRTLYPDEIIEIEIKFTPPHDDQFYCQFLHARVFMYNNIKDINIIKNGGVLHFPLSFNINAVGYSFRNNYSWIPQVNQPKLVILPLTVPGDSVFTTFVIESKSDLPILFKIVSPSKNSHYSVNPVQGIIYKKFQIIIVKFDPKEIDESCIVTEDWEIEYNGPEMDKRKIVFKTAIEVPNIMFEKKNKIHFNFIYPGCRERKTIHMINLTGHDYYFAFVKLYELHAQPVKGIIRSNQKVPITFTLKAVDETLCLRTLQCEARRLINDMVYGEPTIFTFQASGYTSYGKLCALPQFCNLRKIECIHDSQATMFLYNYGLSDIHYVLTYNPSDDDDDIQDPEWVTTVPKKGTIKPNERVEIGIIVNPTIRGIYKGCLEYQIRVIDDSDEIVNNHNPVWPDGEQIFRLKYTAFYPTLQFVSIVENTCGPIFGKVDIWEMMDIKKLNHILATLNHDETVVHYLHLPNAEHSLDIKKQLTFVLEYNDRVPTFCRFVRKKICKCILEEKMSSLTKTQRTYNCPHRQLLDVKISNEHILPRSNAYVTLDMSYKMEGIQTVCFKMLLSQNRCIELMFSMVGLKADGTVLSPYTWNLKFVMQDVYMNIRRPGIQAYWFYNNTRVSTKYNFDTSILDEINNKYGRIVLKCMNPTGTLESKSFHPIYFRFDPVNLKKFNLKLPLTYADKNYELNLICRGVPYFYSPVTGLSGANLGLIDPIYTPFATVVLSQETFVIGTVLTFTRVTRLFFIKNLHRGHTMGFSFDEIKKQNILELSVCPSKGLLRPGETISCMLKICTFGIPSSTRSVLNCFIVDYSQLISHINTKEFYTKYALELQKEFSFNDTKKGQKRKKNIDDKPVILPPPKVSQLSLNITVDISSVIDRDVKIPLEDQEMITSYREIILYRRCQLERLIPDSNPYEHAKINTTLADYHRKISIMMNMKPPVDPPRKQPKCDDCKDRKMLTPVSEDEDYFNTIHSTMEGLIGDLLCGEMFKNLMRQTNELEPLYYSQFKHEHGSEERNSKVKEILNPPPNWLLSMIMEKMINDSLLTYFGQENSIKAFEFDFKDKPENDSSIGLTYSNITDRLNVLKDNYADKFMFLLDNL